MWHLCSEDEGRKTNLKIVFGGTNDIPLWLSILIYQFRVLSIGFF